MAQQLEQTRKAVRPKLLKHVAWAWCNTGRTHNVSTMLHFMQDKTPITRLGPELQIAAAAQRCLLLLAGSAPDPSLRTPKALWVIIDLLPVATELQHTAQRLNC